MGLYGNHIVPRLIDLAMRNDLLTPYRRRVLSAASGRVLEIGIGSGVNLPFYRTAVRQIIGIEPSPKLLEMTAQSAKRLSMTPELIEGTAEALPLDDRSVDTVVDTWTMCSIPDIERAVREMHRVLKPDGRLLFVEHGLAPEPRVRWWQDHFTPLWKRCSGGCHLNRPIADIIQSAGFHIEHLDTAYMGGPKPMTFTYEGTARTR
jgi:ubiquinone/menaquinone biosynthesis C-methylase UbiE